MSAAANLSAARTSPSAVASVALETGMAFLSFFRTEARARKPSDLSTPQFRCLHAVAKASHPSLSQLAEDLGVSAAAMSKLVDGLVERGFLARPADANDRRRLALDLTAQGRKVVERTRAGLEAALRERLSSLDPSEAAALVKALEQMRALFAAEVPA